MAMYLGKQRVTILSQKYTTEKFSFRKTPDFGGLSQSTLFRVKKVKGATVKSKNLIPYPYYETTLTRNGITFTDNGDGSITVNGTATEGSYFYFKIGGSFPVGTYTISGGNSKVFMTARKNALFWVEQGPSWQVPTGSWESGDKLTYIGLNVSKGTTVDNETIYPMLNEGETALPYQPYFTGLKHAHINSIKSTGRNLIPYPFYQNDNYTMFGITFTDNGDGSITVNGTATEYVSFMLFKGVLKAGTYHLSGCNNAGNNLIEMYFATPDFRIYKVDYSSGVKIDLPNDETIMIVINLQPNAVADNLVFKPMLNQGETAFPFEPYKESIWQLPETLELGEWDELNPQTGEVKRYTENVEPTVEKIEGCPLAYTAFKGGTETVIQGEEDNSQFGAIPTIETGHTVIMELIIGDENG